MSNLITKPQLPPKAGYVERVNDAGEHYYFRVPIGFMPRQLAISNSQDLAIPEARNNEFSIKMIGSGGNSSNGQYIETILNLNSGTDIHVEINDASQESVGGTVSFGSYICVLGGREEMQKENTSTIIYGGKEYGKGKFSDTDKATNGIVLISYDQPVYC